MTRSAATVRIAMWSGPRNISTALLRSWGSRADTFVCDEPLYAHYLTQVDVEHPAKHQVIAAHETDWRKVAAWLTGPVPDGKRLFYQKHMAHHLLPHIDRDWLNGLENVFLIREPREMLTSLLKVTPKAGLADTGLPQQVELFERLADQRGSAPPVIDARDVLEEPRAMLSSLCTAVGVPFDEAMLSWEPGPRPTDGVWAEHWYASVWKSTGFGPYRPKPDPVPADKCFVYEECLRLHERLYQHRLRAGG